MECPRCERKIPSENMKFSGEDNGETFERWICSECGLDFTVSYSSEDRISILFVCYGNICRSPMAEFVMKELARKRNLSSRIYVESCSTATEEIGSDVYPPVKDELKRRGIPFEKRSARQMTSSDYENFDYIFPVDTQNLELMERFVGNDPDGKVSLLLSHIGKKDLEDPWYTGRYSEVFDLVYEACSKILDEIQSIL